MEEKKDEAQPEVKPVAPEQNQAAPAAEVKDATKLEGAKPDQVYTPEMIDEPQKNASQWQKYLFVIGIVFTMAVFLIFAGSTIFQINNLQQSIGNGPTLADTVITRQYYHPSSETTYNNAFLTNLCLLENHIIKQRYHQGNEILKVQTYIKFLGFLAGMILAIIGAMFILGKFREYPISMQQQGGISNEFKANLQTTSPGIFLAVLGTLLMMTTILNKSEITVTDGAVYMAGKANKPSEPEPPKKQIKEDSGKQKEIEKELLSH